jgi:hypothetical protein
MSESLDKSENVSKKEKIIINLDEAKIKAVSNTYSLYTSLDVEAGKEVKQESNITRANIRSKEVESVKSLKPELQKPIKKLLSTVSKEQVKKLINPTEEQKGRLFNKKGANTFGDLSEQEKSILMKKMDDWKVNEEVAEINASVAVSWVNNVGQQPSETNKKSSNNKTNKS